MLSAMSRLGLLATLSALILTGCVTSHSYRSGHGGDYYYAEPRIDHYGIDGYPYGSIGYGYSGGWYGQYGFGFGYIPYSRYGFPHGASGYHYGYPYDHYPYWRYTHRPSSHHGLSGGLGPGNSHGVGGGHRPTHIFDLFRNGEHRPARVGNGGHSPPGMMTRERRAPISQPHSSPRPRMEAPRTHHSMPSRTKHP